jgi:hypothetical protein
VFNDRLESENKLGVIYRIGPQEKVTFVLIELIPVSIQSTMKYHRGIWIGWYTGVEICKSALEPRLFKRFPRVEGCEIAVLTY